VTKAKYANLQKTKEARREKIFKKEKKDDEIKNSVIKLPYGAV
ncbi:unnamed protein product, partial [Larinioides sclopetarius]